jgi:hypothetical protein
MMSIDWARLATDLGALHNRGQMGGDNLAKRAIESLLGEDEIIAAVNLAMTHGPGSELALSVLRLLTSDKALDYAYQRYQDSEDGDRIPPIFVIKHMCNPKSIEWIGQFLDDENMATWGVDVLDQLLFSRRVQPDDERVVTLLRRAETHRNRDVREKAGMIKEYLSLWK